MARPGRPRSRPRPARCYSPSTGQACSALATRTRAPPRRSSTRWSTSSSSGSGVRPTRSPRRRAGASRRRGWTWSRGERAPCARKTRAARPPRGRELRGPRGRQRPRLHPVAAPPRARGLLRDLQGRVPRGRRALVHPQERRDRAFPRALGAGDVPLGADGRQHLAPGDRHRLRPEIRRVRLRHHPEPDPQAPARSAPDARAEVAPAPGARAEPAPARGEGPRDDARGARAHPGLQPQGPAIRAAPASLGRLPPVHARRSGRVPGAVWFLVAAQAPVGSFTQAFAAASGIIQWQALAIALYPFCFVEMDGYHVFVDLLGVPTLKHDALSYVKALLGGRARLRWRRLEGLWLAYVVLSALSVAAFFAFNVWIVVRATS